MNQPFYYSWMAQNAAVDFPVASAAHDEFILDDGRRVYDFISTSFQANFGHSHPAISDRITKQLGAMPIASPKSTFELKANVSQRLLDLVGLGEGKIFYTVSGSESVENALKIARQLTGREIVLARKKSYHGASLGALSVTGDWRNAPHLTFDQGTIRIPEHDEDPTLEQTRKIISETGADQIAAVILETISGTNGMSVPHPSWFRGIQSLCREFGIMLILDEVLVGFGRCGSDFAFQQYGLEPDLITLSKAISGGYIPFGAVWTSPEIAARYDDETLACGLTNYGHPLGLAALEGVLDTLADEAFQKNKVALEQTFADFIENEVGSLTNVDEVRCRGLMAAIFLDQPAPTWQQAFDVGLHLYSSGNKIILAPPYISSVNKLEWAMGTLMQLLPKQPN